MYSTLADPAYLIDADGRVAFFSMWTGAPALHAAMDALLGQEGRGVVRGGWERMPHIAPALTDGWRGLRLGLPRSLVDLELASPGMGLMIWLGHQLRPVLAPLTLRVQPLPLPAKLALIAGSLLMIAFAAGRKTRSSSD